MPRRRGFCLNRRGFAAGCEAGAMPRRHIELDDGALPLVRALPYNLGQRPNEGHSPNDSAVFTARHSLASHRAAKPQRNVREKKFGSQQETRSTRNQAHNKKLGSQ